MKHAGLFFFIVYGFLCIYFYQERMLFLDNAFQTFLLITDENIAVNANRWPAMIIRILPLVLIKWGASLKAILLSFSLSYFLFHLIIYLFIQYKLKSKIYALLQILSLSLAVIHSFFWCNSELQLSISLMFLCFAQLEKNKLQSALVSSFVLVWMHPLVLFPFSFCLTLMVIEKKLSISYYLLVASFFVSNYIVKIKFFPNWYDGLKQDAFINNFNNGGIDVLRCFKIFLNHAPLVIPLSLALALFILLASRRYKLGFLFIGFNIIYISLVGIGFYALQSDLGFYAELNFLPVFVISILLIALIIDIDNVSILFLTVLLSSLCMCINVFLNAPCYQERIAWIRKMANENDRAIYKKDNIEDPRLKLHWAIAFESLIATSLEGQSKTFLISDNIERYDLKNSTSFYTHFKNYSIDNLPRKYFQLEKKYYYLN